MKAPPNCLRSTCSIIYPYVTDLDITDIEAAGPGAGQECAPLAAVVADIITA
jgi:hypothetical protein